MTIVTRLPAMLHRQLSEKQAVACDNDFEEVLPKNMQRYADGQEVYEHLLDPNLKGSNSEVFDRHMTSLLALLDDPTDVLLNTYRDNVDKLTSGMADMDVNDEEEEEEDLLASEKTKPVVVTLIPKVRPTKKISFAISSSSCNTQ